MSCDNNNNNSDNNNANLDQTSGFYNAINQKEGNGIDIKKFISDSENKETIHKISTSNDLSIIGEVK